MMKWKIGLIASILTLSSGSLIAKSDSSCCGECNYFDGFYVGGSVGIATNSVDSIVETLGSYEIESSSGAGGTMTDELAHNHTSDRCKTRPWGEIFVGWGKQCSCFYLGGRFGINFSDFNSIARSRAATDFDYNGDIGNTVIDSNLSLIDSLKTDMKTVEYTLDFKPGVVFCDRTMVFGILGAAFNKQHMKGVSEFALSGSARDENSEVIPPFNDMNEIVLEKSRCSAAFRGGFGIEYMFNRCLSLQLSYVYTCYWTLDRRDTVAFQFGQSVPGDGTHTAHFSSKTSKQVTSVGLAYYF